MIPFDPAGTPFQGDGARVDPKLQCEFVVRQSSQLLQHGRSPIQAHLFLKWRNPERLSFRPDMASSPACLLHDFRIRKLPQQRNFGIRPLLAGFAHRPGGHDPQGVSFCSDDRCGLPKFLSKNGIGNSAQPADVGFLPFRASFVTGIQGRNLQRRSLCINSVPSHTHFPGQRVIRHPAQLSDPPGRPVHEIPCRNAAANSLPSDVFVRNPELTGEFTVIHPAQLSDQISGKPGTRFELHPGCFSN
jgi:hypothetical protein